MRYIKRYDREDLCCLREEDGEDVGASLMALNVRKLMSWWLQIQEWYGGVGVPTMEELCNKDVEVRRVNNIVVICYVCEGIGESCMRMCSAYCKIDGRRGT